MLHINDLTYRIEGRLLFDQATAAISAGWKVGFTGKNGTGKSTLFRLLREEISPESGSINLRKNRRIGFVAQEAPSSSASLLETVLEADEERTRLMAEAEGDNTPERVAEIHTRLADIDAHSAEARAATILAGLGFSHTDQQRPCADFSGGWRMRVALAAVLFSDPDLLLLDEPTNYLDLEGAVWLESYLRRFAHTALIISHDRSLLNTAMTHILALENGKLTLHAGNYDTYEKRRAEARAQAMAGAAKQEAARRHMEKFVERFRAKASKATQAQSRLKMLERMKEIAIPVEERTQPFHFPDPKPPMAPPIVRLEQANLGYGDKIILRDLTLRIDQDDRIAILGANGQGKSTLVKAIAGRLSPLAGKIYKSKKLRIAYFAQHQLDELKPDKTILDHIRPLMPEGTEAEMRSRAAQMGFGPQKADIKIAKLSGGEKARALFGLISFDGPHLMILDEPTNHLDMDSREALTQALNDYQGAVMLITHDTWLASAVCDRLWLVDGGDVSPYQGSLEDYRKFILDAAKTQKRTGAAGNKKDHPQNRQALRKQKADARARLSPLRKKIAAFEQEMQNLQQQIDRVDAALAEPGLFEQRLDEATKLSKQRAQLLADLATAEEQWLESSEAYETAKSQSAQNAPRT